MTIFLAPLEYEWTIDLVLADPELIDELDVGWDPTTGKPGREEVRFALGMLDMWSELDRTAIEAGQIYFQPSQIAYDGTL